MLYGVHFTMSVIQTRKFSGDMHLMIIDKSELREFYVTFKKNMMVYKNTYKFNELIFNLLHVQSVPITTKVVS